jgi:hypothetical protein
VDDDQSGARGLLEGDRRGDALPVRALEDVVVELRRVPVAQDDAGALLGHHEVRDVTQAEADLGQRMALQVLREGLEIADERRHRAGLRRRHGKRSPTPSLQTHQQVADPSAQQLPQQPERQRHQAERDVGGLGRAVQHPVLAARPRQPLPHG